MQAYPHAELGKYSAGGVASSAQLALYGEGSKPEAYVPLPDGRRITVNIKIPSLASMKGMNHQLSVTSPVTVYQSLSGAISADGVAQIARTQAAEIGLAISKEFQRNFPNLMRKAFRDNLP